MEALIQDRSQGHYRGNADASLSLGADGGIALSGGSGNRSGPLADAPGGERGKTPVWRQGASGIPLRRGRGESRRGGREGTPPLRATERRFRPEFLQKTAAFTEIGGERKGEEGEKGRERNPIKSLSLILPCP